VLDAAYITLTNASFHHSQRDSSKNEAVTSYVTTLLAIALCQTLLDFIVEITLFLIEILYSAIFTLYPAINFVKLINPIFYTIPKYCYLIFTEVLFGKPT